MNYRNYSWSVDVYHVDANKVGKELEEVEKNMELNAKNVLEYAKNPKTTLNKMFDWDDTSAANKYRLQQAGQIIKNIQVDFVNKNEEVVPVRAFVKTTKKYSENYQNIESVVSDSEKYAMLLSKAYAELNSTKRRYSELEEIQELLKDIPEVL